jgi:hypothetical protein
VRAMVSRTRRTSIMSMPIEMITEENELRRRQVAALQNN